MAFIGYVDLRQTKVGVAALASLSHQTVFRLSVADVLPGSADAVDSRSKLIRLLPELWVLSSKLVTDGERVRAAHRFAAAADDPLVEHHGLLSSYTTSNNRIWKLDGTKHPSIAAFGELLALQPLKATTKRRFRLRCLAVLHELYVIVNTPAAHA